MAPLAHGPPKELPDARAEQVEREAFSRVVVTLGHVERLDLKRPVRHEHKRPELLLLGQPRLPLILRHSHVPKVTHEKLLVLRSEVILITRKLLHLHPRHLAVVVGELRLLLHQFPDEVDRVAVLDPDEGPIKALHQERPGRLDVRGGHAPLQKVEVRLAPFVRVPDHVLDEALGLVNKPIHPNEGTLILDVQKLGEVLRRVRFLCAEGFLARVHLAEPRDGRLERELGRHSEGHGNFAALGVLGEHSRRDRECLPGSLAVADGHDVGISELDVLLIHELVNGEVELRPDAKYGLHDLRTEAVEGKVAEGRHLLLGTLLDGVRQRILHSADEADAARLDLEVLRSRGRTKDDLPLNSHGAADAEALGLGELVEAQSFVVELILRCALRGGLITRASVVLRLDQDVYRPNLCAIVQVEEGDGSGGACADAAHPTVEGRRLVRDEGLILIV
mmetsp:Transcript_326/g.948  ORF Transcript_326/g.948 Transcript_326/m.948 type:complete len:449 (+) Transcript_326:371-1717(+)